MSNDNDVESKLLAAQARLAAKGKTTIKAEKIPKGVSPEKAPRGKRGPKEKKKPVERVAAPHMKKLLKAQELLPQIGTESESILSLIRAMNSSEVENLIEHMKFHLRASGLQRAVSVRDTNTLERGQRVRIISGNPKYVGMEATLDEVRKIRCFVTLPQARGRVYLLTTDVEVISK